jgi:glycosyltransferase involved in cell wall biosynthesis
VDSSAEGGGMTDPQFEQSPAWPLVSVVIPTRDRLEFLRLAAVSVLRQSQDDLELIIVDDASEDGTAAYLVELARRDCRVRTVRNAVPQGGAGARNLGISQSRGHWIAFLDDDDEWLPEKLQRQLQRLKSTASAVACSCNFIMRFSSGRSKMVQVVPDATLQQLLFENELGSASLCICSSNVLKGIGGFDARLRSAQDHDLWVRVRQQGDVVVCDEALVLYSAHARPRITNNMQSQYHGARRFYFKHRHIMDASGRRRRVARNCFLMSRQETRGLRHRLRYLILSMRNSPPLEALSYAASSLPRLVRDALSMSAMSPK